MICAFIPVPHSLARIVGDRMSAMFFIQMLFSAIQLATFMFVLNATNSMSQSNVTAVLGSLSVLLPTYIYCNLSEKVTGRLQVIGDAFYGCAWYCMRVKQQKLFLLPIQRAHQAFRMNGLGIVACSLAIFASVNAINSKSTYIFSILFRLRSHACFRLSGPRLHISCSCAASKR